MSLNVLCYANAPCAPTGFGTVMREIWLNILRRQQVPIGNVYFYGINYHGDPPHNLRDPRNNELLNIYPAQIACTHDPDLFGRQRFAFQALNGRWNFNVLFVLEDHFTVSQPIPFGGQMLPFLPGLVQALRQQGRVFKTIQYVPVDGTTIRPEWVAWMPQVIDYPVAYTEFGRRAICDLVPALAPSMRAIPHGTSTDVFYPLTEEQRRSIRAQIGVPEGAPLLLNVNRNQSRKDIPRTLQVFREVLRQLPDAYLVLHMNPMDSAGFNLPRIVQDLRIPLHRVRFPMNFSEGIGVPVDQLNMIYNSADVYLTTARGEGFGLTLSEAMSVGCACVAPDHSSYSEILADGRGVLVPTDAMPVATVLDNDQMRPLADVRAAADAVVALCRNPERRAQIGAAALAWARQLTWRDHVVPQWEAILRECLPKAQPRLRKAWNAVAEAA